MKKKVTESMNTSKLKIFTISVFLLMCLFLWNINVIAQEKKGSISSESTFKAVGKTVWNEPQSEVCKEKRRMVVGPWVHQPEEYEGYNGFVGWPGLTRLKSGRLLLTFSSGYWHASPPLSEEIIKDAEVRKLFNNWHKIGMPFINAPRGGRAHIMYSDDNGKTWSDPELLVDTELDDRHPTIIELDDGTLMCTFFTSGFARATNARYMLSHDKGKTWSSPKIFPENASSFGNGSAIKLSDGSIILASDHDSPKQGIVILRSTDNGETFNLVSVVEKNYAQYEPTIAQLDENQLVMITRPEGDFYRSRDLGKTWTNFSTGFKIFDPHLVVLPNGVLACFHGSYNGEGLGGLRVILSSDNGYTWHGIEKNLGYPVDPFVYGYSHPMLLPDGTIYIVYIHTGGHHPSDARTEALWTLRIRINKNADGIEILKSPGGAYYRE